MDACTYTEPVDGSLSPSPIAYFEYGAWSLSTSVRSNESCGSGEAAGGVPDVVTVFHGPTSSHGVADTGAFASPLPAQRGAYTVVSIDPIAGAAVYVAGSAWGQFPDLTWNASALGSATALLVAGGNLAASYMVLLDLQVYDRPLPPSAALALSGGGPC